MPQHEPTYTGALLTDKVASLAGWSAADGTITRRYRTSGWSATLMLVNAIGFLAEAADHHPDLEVSWDSVRVTLSTHSAKGVTDKDLALAALFDRTALWRPDKGSPLAGAKKPLVRGG
ncbi:MAG: 4a-hydroxytetrahydrobiopterin dehydratase [Gemmatimonadaceae bacterium]